MIVLVLVLAAALALSVPAPAEAGCGGVQRVQPTKRKFGPKRPPLMIGDSVLLGAMPEVAREGIEINTRGCRQWDEGVDYLRRRRHARTLPRVVIMQLGVNASVTVGQIRKALDITGSRRLLAVMTPREPGGWGGADAQAIRRAGRLYRGRMVVLDWQRHTQNKRHWFVPDGIHLTHAGARGLGRYLRRHRRYLRPPDAPAQAR